MMKVTEKPIDNVTAATRNSCEFDFHNVDIYHFFYGAHSFTYIRTVFWKNYIFLPCSCLTSSWSASCHPPDPHFWKQLKLNQIVYFKVGRTSTHRYDSNASKIIVLRPADPEIVHSELWFRKIAACDAMWPTANYFENGNKLNCNGEFDVGK